MERFQFLLRHEWDWRDQLRPRFQAPPRDALTLLQYENLRARIPLLYLALAIISVAAAMVAQGQFFSAIYFGFPGLLCIASIARFVVWSRRRRTEATAEMARGQIARTFWLTVALISLTSIWTVSGFYETDEPRRMLPPIFMAFGAIASATCLASLPRAALAALIIGMGPIAVAMILSGDPAMVATGASLAVVAMFQGRLILAQFTAICRNLRLRAQLEKLADVDPLTGLCNRRAFDRVLHEAIGKGESFVLAMLDLDRFKPVNDTHGHAVGDELLRAVGKRLEANCRHSDLVARLGGDEFALVLRAPPEPGALPKWRNRLEARLGTPYRLRDTELTVPASVGTARFPVEGTTAEALYAYADAMLYRAKEAAHADLTRISGRARHFEDVAAMPMARQG